MSATDAPDWERIITTVKAAGDVPDAPDWERIVVGPGGAPVGGGGHTWDEPGAWGLAGWSFGPWTSQYGGANYSSNDQLVLGLLTTPSTATVDHIVLYNVQADTALSGWTAVLYETGSPTNQPYMGSGGTQSDLTLIGQSATGAMDGLCTGNVPVIVALTASVALEAGYWYYAGFLTGSYSTGPGFAVQSGGGSTNFGLSNNVNIGGRLNNRYATPPASVAPSWYSMNQWQWGGVY